MKIPKDPIYWPGANETILKKVTCEIEEPLTTCPTCSGHFKPHNRLQKYCDTSCRNKANYKKHKRINRGELIAWLRVKAEYRASVDIDTILEFLGEDE